MTARAYRRSLDKAPVEEDGMSWNGHIVVDMDAHIRERADRFFLDYIDPAYRAPYQLLCEAVARLRRQRHRGR